MALDEIEDVLWAWRDRLLSIRADKRIKYALVFKITDTELELL